LASLGLIVEELGDPFGNHANDLPTKKTAENIQRQLEELLEDLNSNVSLRAATE
jgi:putative membrane protein